MLEAGISLVIKSEDFNKNKPSEDTDIEKIKNTKHSLHLNVCPAKIVFLFDYK